MRFWPGNTGLSTLEEVGQHFADTRCIRQIEAKAEASSVAFASAEGVFGRKALK
jgi:hypothetical protein